MFVVDTHMDRIAERLGLVKQTAKYDEIQEAIKRFIPKDERVGGLFWLLAKYTCRAQNPKCSECLLAETCAHAINHKDLKQTRVTAHQTNKYQRITWR